MLEETFGETRSMLKNTTNVEHKGPNTHELD